MKINDIVSRQTTVLTQRMRNQGIHESRNQDEEFLKVSHVDYMECQNIHECKYTKYKWTAHVCGLKERHVGTDKELHLTVVTGYCYNMASPIDCG